MARAPAVLDSQSRVSDFLTISLLYKYISREQVETILIWTGKKELRLRHLPSFIIPFYVVTLSLFKSCSSKEVHRIFFEGTTWAMRSSRLIDAEEVRAEPVSKSAISQARTRLGWKPMEALFNEVVSPSVEKSDIIKRYKEWFLVGFSSGVIKIAGSAENLHEFMTPNSNGEKSSPPHMKFVSLVEHGSRLIFAAETASFHAKETTIAEGVVYSLRNGMLCMAGKSFFSLTLWQESLKTGADLLWEIGPDIKFSVKKNCTDRSFLATLKPANSSDSRDKEIEVRVIKYRTSSSNRSVRYLVTNLLNPEEAPAIDLASLFNKRLKMEETTDILNTHHGVQNMTMRSKTPDLVRQEFFGLLLATFILRKTVLESDWGKDVSPYGLRSESVELM